MNFPLHSITISKSFILKFSLRLMIFSFSGFIAYKTAYLIAEKFFFDKFFFYKSEKYGYFTAQAHSLEDFSPRSDDIVYLLKQSQLSETGQSPQVLGRNSETYTVAVIGDSFVWGQGLKTEDTFPSVLEKKLNQFRKTDVISLAQSGDSILDHYQKYALAQKLYSVDLYIFLLVENDLVYNNDPRYSAGEYNSIIQKCEEQTGTTISKFADREDVEDDYATLLVNSPKNPANLCVLEYISARLPNSNAIYLVADDYKDKGYIYDTYTGYLKKNHLFVLSLTDTKDWPEFQEFWKEPYRFYPVSNLEPHPSRYMSNMYTSIIYKQLMDNDHWEFNAKGK